VSKHLAAFLAGLAVLPFLVAGCGGGSSSSDETVAKLTKAEYVKKASAICAANGRRMGAALTSYTKKHPLGKNAGEAQADELIEAVALPGFRAEVEELQDLPAPRGDEAQVEVMLAKFEAGLEGGEEDPASLFVSAKSEFAKGTKLAEAFGLSGCGRLFVSRAQ
jgi:hypothetical protein